MRHRLAVIGAGIAGLHLARRLSDRGLDVTVFDKARGPGGRMAARRLDPGTIDLGAQFITATDPAFRAALDAWSQAGVVAVWNPREATIDGDAAITPRRSTVTRFVGTPRMSAITRHLARGLTLRAGHRITTLTGGPGDWCLHDAEHDAFGPFTAVYTALPDTLTRDLLATTDLDLAPVVASRTAPCWAGLFAFQRPLAVSWDLAECQAGPLATAIRNSSKPGRGRRETWVVHADTSWSATMLEHEREPILAHLTEAFAGIAGPLPPTTWAAAHRWRYARVTRVAPRAMLHDARLGLGACGDWGVGARVEGAWLSADRLADAILGVAA